MSDLRFFTFSRVCFFVVRFFLCLVFYASFYVLRFRFELGFFELKPVRIRFFRIRGEFGFRDLGSNSVFSNSIWVRFFRIRLELFFRIRFEFGFFEFGLSSVFSNSVWIRFFRIRFEIVFFEFGSYPVLSNAVRIRFFRIRFELV